MKSTYSQSGQDLYVLEKLNNKTNGVYIEIGAGHPETYSNTLLLEKKGWYGLSFDINDVDNFSNIRKNKLILEDCRYFNFKKYFEDVKLPKHIDYISFDIDEMTLDCLKIFPLDTYQISVITIEHNEYLYTQGIFDYPCPKNEIRAILQSRGYILDKPDIKHDGLNYEDWFISSDIQ